MELKAAQARIRFLPALILLGAMAIPAAAQEGCTGFGWPMSAEIAWMTAADSQAAETGAKMPGLAAKAIELKLKPSKEVTLPVKSGKKKQGIAADSYSGWFEIAGLPKAGLYQVSLSHEGWIDVAQNGELVQSKGFTGRKDCKAVHKSVRFELSAGPVIVEISGAPVETVKVSVREVN